MWLRTDSLSIIELKYFVSLLTYATARHRTRWFPYREFITARCISLTILAPAKH